MREELLLIGEVKVFEKPVIMKCLGLGSCIGLFIKDISTGITGGAHIFLPERPKYSSLGDGFSAFECIDHIIGKMKSLGGNVSTLSAKLAGGANPLMNSCDIGHRNFEFVSKGLMDNDICITAVDVGGNISRTVRYNAISQKLEVRQLEKNIIKII